MVIHYVSKTIVHRGRPTGGIESGVVADTYIRSTEETARGSSDDIFMLYNGADICHGLIRIRNNLEKDYGIKKEDIITMYLGLVDETAPVGFVIVLLKDINVEWEEFEATKTYRKTAIGWTEIMALKDCSEPLDSDSLSVGGGPAEKLLNIKRWKDEEDINLLLQIHDDGVAPSKSFIAHSLDQAVVAYKPFVQWTVRVYSPEAFKDQASALSIVPYNLDPNKPQLKWGKIEPDPKFTAIKIYRKTSIFTQPSDATLIATLTDFTQTEYVDNSALSNNQQYFYMATVESTDNTLNSSTFSNVVSFTKPDITSLTYSPAGPYSVGQQISITVVSPQLIKKVWVDWKDGTQSWYEFETASTTQIVSHYISSVITTQTPEVRVEDVYGFWSDKESASSISTTDTSPIAKLVVNEKSVIQGEYVILSGVYSQPKASNTTITKYEFSLDNGGSWIDNLANPVYSLNTVAMLGTYLLKLRITTGTGLQATTSAVSLMVIIGTPEELFFSQDTHVEEITHSLSMNKDEKTPIGSDQVEYDFLMSRRPDILSISMSSATPHLEEDINIIREAWANDKYIRLRTRAEKETKEVVYDGTINGDIEIVQQFQGNVIWNFRLKVISKTESFIPGKSGVITAVSSGGPSTIIIQSANHGLVSGAEVDIRGTTDYDGGNVVISIISPSLFEVRGTYTITKTGSWIKKTYANLN